MLTPAIILLSISSFFPHPQVQTKHVRVEGWAIERRADRFTGWIDCTARHGRMALVGAQVIFDFGRGVNTGRSVYRIDDGEARLAQQSSFARAYWNQHETDAPLENPSGGVLALPAKDLLDIRKISIRLDTAGAPQTFKIDPLRAVLETEYVLGCPYAEQTLTPASLLPPRQ